MIGVVFLFPPTITWFVAVAPMGRALPFTTGIPGTTANRRVTAAHESPVAAISLPAQAGRGNRMQALRIIGSSVPVATALGMVFRRRAIHRQRQSEINVSEPTVLYMSLPLIAGSGATTSTISPASRQPGLAEKSAVTRSTIPALLATLPGFKAINHIPGYTEIPVATRLPGLLSVALSARFGPKERRDFQVPG